MSKLNKDEQTIHDALSQINVDSTGIAEGVKSRLKEKHRSSKGHPTRRTMILAVAISAMLIVTVSAATLGKFDWFMEKFNPNFSEIVTPIEVVSEDKGIRMEVIGAQKYENKAVVYLSLQDVSGQNRLTEQT